MQNEIQWQRDQQSCRKYEPRCAFQRYRQNARKNQKVGLFVKISAIPKPRKCVQSAYRQHAPPAPLPQSDDERAGSAVSTGSEFPINRARRKREVAGRQGHRVSEKFVLAAGSTAALFESSVIRPGPAFARRSFSSASVANERCGKSTSTSRSTSELTTRKKAPKSTP